MKIIIANSKNWFNISKSISLNNEIVFINNKNDFNIDNIKKIEPKLIFLPHWNWIVPKEIYNKFECIVFHTSPLPYGRGGSPIQNLILNGFKKSPVCALKLTKNIDSGPIYKKEIISLEGSLKDIFINLNTVVNKMIDELINYLPNPQIQDGEVFIFKRLQEEDNLIPDNISIKKIFDRIRMLDDESYPNAFINYGNFKIDFYDAKFINGEIICKAKIINNLDKLND